LGDLEHLVDLRIDVAQNEASAGGIDLFVERDEFPEGGAGKILHVAEIQQDLAPPQLVDQAEKLFANDLNILFVKDFLIGKVYDGHVADVFDLEAASTRLCGHTVDSCKC